MYNYIIINTNYHVTQEDNVKNKSTTYSTDNYEAYVPTPMSSSLPYLSSEFSNVLPINTINSSTLVNENTVPVTHVQPTGNLQFNKTVF